MIGAALVVIGTFLPWLELNGGVRSGWAIFRLTGVLGANPAVISPMFGGGGSDVFFTGAVTLALGMLSLLLMAGALITRRIAPSQSPKEGMALVVSATLSIAATLVVTTVNLRTARLGAQGFGEVVHYGLWVTFVGGWVGTLGMAVSITGRRSVAQQRRERDPAKAAAELVVPQGKPPASAMSESSGRVRGETMSRSGVDESSGMSGGSEPSGRSGGDESSGTLAGREPSGSSGSGESSGTPAGREPSGSSGGGESAAGRSGSSGHSLTRALAILLFLVGFGGFVVAAASDQSVQKSSAADEATLGQRNPVAAAKTLRSGFTSVNAAFNAYAAASQVVATARQDVTDQFARAAAASGRGGAGSGAASPELSRAIAAHEAAVAREQAARQTYVDRLDALVKEVHP